MIMDSSKNGRWNIPFKILSRLKVKINCVIDDEYKVDLLPPVISKVLEFGQTLHTGFSKLGFNI